MQDLVVALDKVASHLEQAGKIALATELDKVSNALEVLAFNRGEVVPFGTVDRVEDRLEYLDDVLTTLGNTELAKEQGGDAIITKVKQMLVQKKPEVSLGDISTILKDFRKQGYDKWVDTLSQKYGESIPDKFFYKGKSFGTFEDLKSVFHILDEKLSEDRTPKEKPKREDFYDFAKKELAKTALGPTLPSKFLKIQKMIQALMRSPVQRSAA